MSLPVCHVALSLCMLLGSGVSMADTANPNLLPIGQREALLANAGQVPVEVAAEEETGGLGLARLIASQLGDGQSALESAPSSRRRFEPEWPVAKARADREQWLDFVARALA